MPIGSTHSDQYYRGLQWFASTVNKSFTTFRLDFMDGKTYAL